MKLRRLRHPPRPPKNKLKNRAAEKFGSPVLDRRLMKEVTIYTDGACSGNPGPGGWGAILMYGEHKKELSGGEPATTNNRMELLGVINALETLKEPCAVTLYTDSQYVVNAINEGWLFGWKKKNWKRKGGDVKNPDLWQRVYDLIHVHQVKFVWVKGHAENEYNNRCDQLAVEFRKKFE
jgi:ribonuclease HI